MFRKHRWPNGVKCPYCASENICYVKAPNKPYVQRYRCKTAEDSSTTSPEPLSRGRNCRPVRCSP
ncbi:MAG: transposase [Candidatus Baldrarchaeia archaeon]